MVAAALVMKEAMLCWSMTSELGFEAEFDDAPRSIDETAILDVIGNRTSRAHAEHVASHTKYLLYNYNCAGGLQVYGCAPSHPHPVEHAQ